MAGSWNHMTTKKGKLRSNESMRQMLENGGDVYEALEECYGMVWQLASQLDVNLGAEKGAAFYVEEAQTRWKDGISFSPGVQGEG